MVTPEEAVASFEERFGSHDGFRRLHAKGWLYQGTFTATPEPRGAREAAGTLLVTLSPQERAAVVLKDVFDLTLEEIAEALSTTVGGVKAALHRGRGKLMEPAEAGAPAPTGTRTPAPGVLDAFCAAFNARDLARLTALLLDTATVEIVGVVTESGAEVTVPPPGVVAERFMSETSVSYFQ